MENMSTEDIRPDIKPEIKMALTPSESGEFIVKNAKHIKVNQSGINALSEEVIQGIRNNTINVENFSQHEHHPDKTDPHAVQWIFLIDTLNFCFWTPGNETKWKVRNETGYFALCAAINRALGDLDITNPSIYSKLEEEELGYILRSDDGVTQIPLLTERVQVLRQVGTTLLEKYDGKFENCIIACDKSAEKLLKLIVSEFPCFRDEAVYANQKVSLYKRAQILIGDLWACFEGEGLGCFNDIHKITMFADYRVPQVLVHFKALEYSPELFYALQRNEILENGDEREVEIRGASIYIVELLKKKILKDIDTKCPCVLKGNVNSILLDHFLWDYRRKHASELQYIPFHKTYSIYY